jgi:plastocyanin
MRLTRVRTAALLVAATAVTGLTLGSSATPTAASAPRHPRHVVTIPDTDKFVPFQMTVHVGDRVTWINSDTDDHTIVSDRAFNTAGHSRLDVLIKGTDANKGRPGVFSLRFDHPGTFVYYCRFHAHLDSDAQPVAPGPRGGIQDANGNFGTPMNGLITVVDDHHDDR